MGYTCRSGGSSARCRPLIWVGVFIFITSGLYGQQDFRGSIEGLVKDSTGGAIPGVTITATLVSQNKTQTVLSNDNGFYHFSYLTPGTYRLKATMPGFKTYEQSEIVLQVNDKLTIDIALSIGQVSEEIIVRGDTTPLIQQTQNFDQTVDQRQVEDLPMNGRNSYQLFGLAAGVLPEGDPTLMRPFDNNNTSELTIGGTGSRGTEFSLDGGANTGGRGRISFIPSTEAVKEFKVTTSAFDASVGNTTGPIINAGLKSGGEQFHGSLYEYFRNSALDANFWTSNRQGQRLPSAKWNQFGGALGGPLRIPFRQHGKDQTFFFVNYEGMRVNRVNSPFVRTLPTERERRGDFSQTHYVTREGEARRITIYDPLSTRCVRNCDRPPDPNRPGRTLAPVYQRDPFPDNVIPADRLNPVALQLLRFIPLPNQPGDPRTGRDNFVRNGMETDHYDQLIARIDHHFSERQNMFVSVSYSNRDHFLPNWLGNIASPNLAIGKRGSRRFVLDDTYSLRSGLVINFQYALARYADHYRQTSLGIDLASVGLTPEFIAKIRESYKDTEKTALPDINIGNYIRLGPSSDHVKTNIANDTHELRLNFTKVLGKHGLRWGFNGRALRRNEFNFGLPSGRLSFGKGFTHGPNPYSGQRVDAGNELATFLLGYPTDGYIEQRTTFAIQDLYLGAFVQDDLKLSSRLTINLGLRWEYWLPRTERFNRMTRGFAYDRENPIAPDVQDHIQQILNDEAVHLSPEIRDVFSNLQLRGGLLYAGQDGAPRGQLNSRPLLFAPRLGFAFKVSNKMVLRGGAGLYFEPLTRVAEPPQDGFNARTNYTSTITTDETGPQPLNSLSDPFPEDLVQPTGFSRGMLTNIGQNVFFVNPDRTAPRVFRAEFGVQRELPGRIGINANYMTTRWRGRPIDLEINELPDALLARGADFLYQSVPNPFYGVLPSNSTLGRNRTINLDRLLRPYPQFNSVQTNFNLGYAWYHGFNLNVSRRMQRGLFFQASYTVSKGMTATSYANPDDRKINKLDRRLLDDDRPQRLVLNSIYELPFGRNKRFLNNGWRSKVLGGWQVSGISTFMSGRPVHFDNNRNYAVATGENARLPNGPYYDPTLGRWVWFNRRAFRVRRTNPVAELLNVPRNLPNVRSDGINTIDMRLTRNFPFNERVRMQFIAETFNLTNRVQYRPPETDIRNVNFGTTASQANWPRSFQFSLRLQF